MLFNEPKLLKFGAGARCWRGRRSFSALQRAEIAEIVRQRRLRGDGAGFSALQRAEIAEIVQQFHVDLRPASPFQCSSTSRNC